MTTRPPSTSRTTKPTFDPATRSSSSACPTTLEVDPPPRTWFESVDPFGNAVATFVVQGGFTHMSVTATSEVLVTPSPPPPAGPPWESVRTLLEIDRQPSARDARRCRAPSRLIPTANSLVEYARRVVPAGPTPRRVGHGPGGSHPQGVRLRARLHLDLDAAAGGVRATPWRVPGLRTPDDRLLAVDSAWRPDTSAGTSRRSRPRARSAWSAPMRRTPGRRCTCQAGVGWMSIPPTINSWPSPTSPRPGDATTGTCRHCGVRSREVGGSHRLDVAVDVNRVATVSPQGSHDHAG